MALPIQDGWPLSGLMLRSGPEDWEAHRQKEALRKAIEAFNRRRLCKCPYQAPAWRPPKEGV